MAYGPPPERCPNETQAEFVVRRQNLSDIARLRAENIRMRDALLAITEDRDIVGGGSLRTAADDVAVLGANAALLRERFS